MGAAVGVIEGARALHVPRARFVPVKTTNDLLGLRSDAYALTEDAARRARAPGERCPFVDLDADHYKLLRDFEARFPAGPPSLIEAERFEVEGDVGFGAARRRARRVVVKGPETIEDGTDL